MTTLESISFKNRFPLERAFPSREAKRTSRKLSPFVKLADKRNIVPCTLSKSVKQFLCTGMTIFTIMGRHQQKYLTSNKINQYIPLNNGKRLRRDV